MELFHKPSPLVERIVVFGGILVSFVCFGLAQEELAVMQFGEAQERFDHFSFVISYFCLINSLAAGFVLLVSRPAATDRSLLSLTTLFGKVGWTYVLAMLLTNVALMYVSYPTQVLVKSCKMIPVMLANVVLFKRKYNWREYLCVGLICTGIITFTMKDSLHSVPTDNTGLYWFGVLLCLVSLSLDGWTNAMQEALVREHSPTDAQLLFSMNSSGFLFAVPVCMLSGDFLPSVRFCIHNPEVLWPINLCAFSMLVGQYFLMKCINLYGNLTLTKVTTLRKFVTVLFSVIIYGHQLTPRMWLGTFFVFAGLFLELWNKEHNYHHHHHNHHDDLSHQPKTL
eukprot:gnl/Spiro4/4861_TR2426_c0_g1_i1.p1 gnl/Spiro4/4861_TR2426_c0_g1~~gnl/Spiro4/4861_TR2426_c0_g1_i1.p1  ORF type:complete len:339 (+),score=55.05 gnl/Spiro4/4861_TR2426_c0_g1_i1:52-1068(+)